MSRTSGKSLEVTKVNRIGLATVLVLALAVTGSAERNQQDETIARPASRASTTAFVPRLGKRFDGPMSSPLERFLCANSQDCAQNGADLERAYSALTQQQQQQQQQQQAGSALYSDEQLDSTARLIKRIEAQAKELKQMLASLLASQQQAFQQSPLPRRETRASDDLVVGELISGGDGGGSNGFVSSSVGSKRVAFTPRIGRRR